MSPADDVQTDEPTPAGRPGKHRIGLFAVVAALALALDAVSKSIVAATLDRHPPVRILDGAIYLDEARNPGAAFSLGTGFTIVLTVIALAVVAVILRTAGRMRSAGWAVALGLVLGGALGNLGDRIFRAPGVGRGYVVDWISLFGPDGAHWPIFNLADSAIVCGAILAAVLTLCGIEIDRGREVSERSERTMGIGLRRPRSPAAVSDVRLLPLPDGLDGLRLDVALARLLGLSRTAAAELIDEGNVLVDGTAVVRSAKVRGGTLLEVTMPAAAEVAPPQLVAGLTVRHDDDDVVVVAKPVGVAAHPSPGWNGPTVVGGLAAAGYRIATSGAAERQGIVHRLDAGTSGVMVVAKSERAYTALKRAFKQRTVDKRYAALVQGHPDPSSGTIDAPIDRHPSADYKFAVVAGGRASVTHYETVEALRAATLLDIRLETGRTHQIRVHMAAVRHPCVGDLTYGADPVLARRLGLSRQWLHARELGFTHPGTGEWLVVSAPLPDDLRHALDMLRDES